MIAAVSLAVLGGGYRLRGIAAWVLQLDSPTFWGPGRLAFE